MKDVSEPVQKKVPRDIGAFVLFIAREIIAQRKWMLFPVFVLLCIAAILLFLGSSSMLLPAIYIAF